MASHHGLGQRLACLGELDASISERDETLFFHSLHHERHGEAD
ncbi:MAG: hypothetical protein R2706_17495 [Acidimicrobiales bacterium]